MIIVWACVIALSLLIEFLTYDLITLWFAPAALVGLILAAASVGLWWQIIAFIIFSGVFIATLRPVLKKFLIKETIPTNITDSNIGRRVRLTSPMRDGYSTIELNGVTWTAKITSGDDLAEGDIVEITGNDSNKMLVKLAEAEKPKAVKPD